MDEVIEILNKLGAIIYNSHFVGTKGVHFDTYMNKDVLYPHTKETSRICELFAERYKDKNIEVVVGPALGGIILSQWVTYHLNKMGSSAISVFTEKDKDEQFFSRGYDKLIDGKQILIVEDNISTGGSIKKVIKAVQDAGGNIIGVCAMVNRNPDVNSNTLGVSFESLSEFFVPLYSATDCPLCKQGVSINTTLGHGKKFLEEQENKK
ncbi:MAG: phosphoribosyltransferase family protein [Patescibacteria group bacterium]